MAEEKLHKQAREEYQREHPHCEMPGCSRSILKGHRIENHHRAGRNGPLLYTKSYFCSLCPEHHQYVESHLSWSRANGWIIDLTTEQVRALKS